ncbi:MAG: bifunctional biotin--[acetyl-CoA-carboxylase] ligase/biotin operon repressor BirA [Thiogranum sp.]|nr:bifunctional biotin--[acetyl-CoA-carboxylase] ligase/biotin operon repressor BirA [Thiogranum sp.]
MSTRSRLIELLADGRFRSGEWLGEQLGTSRAAVWKQVRGLIALGLDVQAVRGKGYRLSSEFEPLNADTIRSSLTDALAPRLASIEVFQELDSTSEHLKRTRGQVVSEQGIACLAEWQSAGRGRRGRRWISPYGSNLYMSLAWQLGGTALGSGGFSLVVAIAVLRALQQCGVDGLGVKWPNDILFQGRKLAGILLDISGESSGPFTVIIGVGVNCNLPARAAQEIDQPWADLSQTGVDMDRNRLAAMILESLLQAIDAYSAEGLDAFMQEWARFDLVSGRLVELQHGPGGTTSGVARGVDSQGALLIEKDGITRSFHAGEVSVRLA